jgi:hypothetical protein
MQAIGNPIEYRYFGRLPAVPHVGGHLPDGHFAATCEMAGRESSFNRRHENLPEIASPAGRCKIRLANQISGKVIRGPFPLPAWLLQRKRVYDIRDGYL